MSITGAVEGLGSIANLVNNIIGQLDTPEKRAKARREFLSLLLSYLQQVKNEEDAEVIKQIILDWMSVVDSR